MIYLDVTRLLRMERSRPDGISRVEMAYLDHFLARPAHERAFVADSKDRLTIVSDDLMRVAREHIKSVWSGGDESAPPELAEAIEDARWYTRARSLTDRLARLSEMSFNERLTLIRKVDSRALSSLRATDMVHSALAQSKARLPAGMPPRRKTIAAAGMVASSRQRMDEISAETASTRPSLRVDPELIARLNNPAAIYLNANQVVFWGFERFCAIADATKARMAVMIHDLIPLFEPEMIDTLPEDVALDRLRWFNQPRMTLIANSQSTANEIARGLDMAGAPMDGGAQIVVAPLGAPEIRRTATKEDHSDGSYFLTVGTLQPRKNIGLLLQVWRRLLAEKGADIPKLVIVGAPGWLSDPEIHAVREMAARGCVRWEPHLADDALTELYRGARAVLFPSLAEGWGLPLVEALDMGTPVICSDIPIFHEVGGKAPEFIDPLDGLSWKRAVEDYASDGSSRRANQIERIRDFAPQHWDSHFRIVRKALNFAEDMKAVS